MEDCQISTEGIFGPCTLAEQLETFEEEAVVTAPLQLVVAEKAQGADSEDPHEYRALSIF